SVPVYGPMRHRDAVSHGVGRPASAGCRRRRSRTARLCCFGRYGRSLVTFSLACVRATAPPCTSDHHRIGDRLVPSTRNYQDGCRVANIKSQIKRNKQNEKARLRNKAVKSSLKTAIRKYHAAVEAGDVETAGVLMRDASKKLDKAVSKGVIHANQAANRKS